MNIKDMFALSRAFLTRKGQLLAQKDISHAYIAEGRRLAIFDKQVTNILSQTWDPKSKAVAQAFEEMLEHPLCKQFKRNKLQLVIRHEPLSSKLALGKKPNISSIRIIGNKIIEFPEAHWNNLTVDEIIEGVAHEIGHYLALDFHARNGLKGRFVFTKKREQLADDIRGVLSGNYEAFDSALHKMTEANNDKIREYVDHHFHYANDPVTQKVKNWIIRCADGSRGGMAYPSHAERASRAKELSEKLATPEGRSFIEAEIARKLETKHRKLFPHHFSRDIPNYRAR